MESHPDDSPLNPVAKAELSLYESQRRIEIKVYRTKIERHLREYDWNLYYHNFIVDFKNPTFYLIIKSILGIRLPNLETLICE